MRPAWSIIVFTSLSGLGLGLLFWFGLGFVAINDPIDVILFTILGSDGGLGRSHVFTFASWASGARLASLVAVAFVMVISGRCLCRGDHPLHAHLLGSLVYRR